MSSSNKGSLLPDKSTVLQGYLKKLKTMKKKYFVLYKDSAEKSARLEYYDSEKKFKSRYGYPKRSIVLKSCFHINRRLDTKHKFVVSLYTKDDCFCIVYDAETEMNKWLRELLALHRFEEAEGDKPRANFEHVWQVQVQRKGLAEEKGIIGNYHLCLTDKSLTLVRTGPSTTIAGETRMPMVEFMLNTIRRCGDSQCYFYMEFGRHSAIGAGELWMGTEDPLIAQNMHKTIINAMSAIVRQRDDFGPITRNRSSSANEASKPIFMLQRRQTHVGGAKPFNFSPSAISSVSHQRALSLPIPTSLQSISNTSNSSTTSNLPPNAVANKETNLAVTTTTTATATAAATTVVATGTTGTAEYVLTHPINNSMVTTTSYTIMPIHQRTRSLPLTEETAIQVTSFHSNISPPLGNNTSQCNCNNDSSNITAGNTGSNNHFKSCSLLTTNNNNNNNSSSGNAVNTLVGHPQCQHHQTHHSTPHHCHQITTISHFYNRHNSNSFDSNQSIGEYREQIGTNHVMPLTAMANSMESIDEDQTLSTDGGLSATDDDQGRILKNKTLSIGGHTYFLGGSPLSMRRGGRGNSSSASRSSAIGRERCDSLPSRNRTSSETIHANLQNTSMPPPRSIPSLNRPHSMYTQRHSHSHSPPVHTIPLSPSAGCSESDGSSLSIDETDGYTHSITPDEGSNFGSKYYRTSGLVIPEENPDDFWFTENNKRNMPYIDEINSHGTLSLPIYQNQSGPPRKDSPGPPVYTEMYSPNGSSPGDHPMGSGYMIMSPGADFGRSLYTSSSGAQSRASSLAEEAVDGYVPIEPPHHPQEEYVDMEQSNRHQTTSGMSSAASSCSITSGTPSTDLRFAEYQLDKVVSRFTPDDEDTSLLTERRPIRAYSVGSRLEHNKRKLRVDLLAAEHNNARARAFSVGSRAKMPRSELYRGVIQTAHLSNITQETAANVTNNNSKSNKSLSAPMLINKSQSSIDPMDDLMEIDYTGKNSDNSTPIKMSKPVSVPVAKRYDGLSDMLPGREKTTGYVEMKPAMNAHENFSTHSHYGYMEMKPVGGSSSYQSNLSSSPKKSITSPKSIPNTSTTNRNNNYMDMTPRSMRMNQRISDSPQGSSDDYLNMSPFGQNSKDKSMDVDLPKTLSAPEGYMEMSWDKSSMAGGNVGGGSNNNLLEKPASDEYINMNFNRKDGSNKETRLSSLPIAIQLNKFNQNVHKTAIGNLPPSSINLSTLMKNTRLRCDSKDSGIVTPSGSHPSIFPFSPGSPNKPFSSQNPLDENNLPRKCLVDASTGILRLSESDAENSNSSWLPADSPAKILNTDVYMEMPSASIIVPPVVDKLSNDYADMSIRSKKPKTPEKPADVSDYVNCNPLTATLSKPIINKSTDSIPPRDYEIMNPALTRKIPATVPDQQQSMVVTSTPASTKKSVLVTINSNPDKLVASTTTKASLVGFKPITTLDEQLMKNCTKDTSCRPRYSATFSRQLSEKIFSQTATTEQNDSSGYEMLQMRNDNHIPSFQGRILSRPNSVNSEKISSSSAASVNNLTRPNSANSDRLPTISTSSSSSTLCGSSSSSQTLCGSKCQSPLPTGNRPQSFGEMDSRPESVSSHHITSRPPSVSSERELHYASLDLPPPSSEKAIGKLGTDSASIPSSLSTTIPSTVTSTKMKSNSVSGDSSSSSSSPNAGSCSGGGGGGIGGVGETTVHAEQPTFTYAQIDFIRSESINAAPNNINAIDAIASNKPQKQLQSPTQQQAQQHQSQTINN